MDNEKIEKRPNQILVWAGNVFKVALAVIAVVVVCFTLLSAKSVDNTDGTPVFGYRFFIVLSDSMQGTFDVGDLIASKEVDTSTLEVGDVITFVSTADETDGEIITHKIREITQSGGELAFVTYGTTTETDDPDVALASNVLGEYRFAIPKAGYFLQFLKTPMGYVCCILLPFALLIVLEFANIFKILADDKALQKAQAQSERDALEAELAQMRAALAAVAAGAPVPQTAQPVPDASAPPEAAMPVATAAEPLESAEGAPSAPEQAAETAPEAPAAKPRTRKASATAKTPAPEEATPVQAPVAAPVGDVPSAAAKPEPTEAEKQAHIAAALAFAKAEKEKAQAEATETANV